MTSPPPATRLAGGRAIRFASKSIVSHDRFHSSVLAIVHLSPDCVPAGSRVTLQFAARFYSAVAQQTLQVPLGWLA